MASENRSSDSAPEEQTPKSHQQSKVSWYTEDVRSIPSEARDLLESYSKIPSDQVIPHVLSLVSLTSP